MTKPNFQKMAQETYFDNAYDENPIHSQTMNFSLVVDKLEEAYSAGKETATEALISKIAELEKQLADSDSQVHQLWQYAPGYPEFKERIKQKTIPLIILEILDRHHSRNRKAA